jgi:hypothetical protein
LCFFFFLSNSYQQDCISELPDEIIVSILSRVTLREAVVTSVLSRRWKYLWAFTTTLDFYPRITSDYIEQLDPYSPRATDDSYLDYLIEIERPRYVNWVNRVLGQYRGPTIDEFRVWIDLDKSYAGDINRWIMFAMQKRVQRLEMHLCGFIPWNPWNFERYTFPDQLLFRCQTRGPAQAQLCGDAFVGFKSLRDLNLKAVNVSWEVLKYFLANCPNLERLVVHRSENLEKLRVVGSSLPLKHLEVSTCLRLKYIKIRDTNLVSFKYAPAAGRRIRVLVNNAPLLVDVSFSEGPHNNSLLRQLSSWFSQLQTLTVSKPFVGVSVYKNYVFVHSFLHSLCCHAIYPCYGFFSLK